MHVLTFRHPHWGWLALLKLLHWGYLIKAALLRLTYCGCLIKSASFRIPYWGCHIENAILRVPHWGSCLDQLKLIHYGYLVEATPLRLYHMATYWVLLMKFSLRPPHWSCLLRLSHSLYGLKYWCYLIENWGIFTKDCFIIQTYSAPSWIHDLNLRQLT